MTETEIIATSPDSSKEYWFNKKFFVKALPKDVSARDSLAGKAHLSERLHKISCYFGVGKADGISENGVLLNFQEVLWRKLD